MAPVFELYDLAHEERGDGDTLTDVIAGIAVMTFIIGAALFLGGLV
ncbi:hypothetical protein [Nitratireductor luteus]|nr:hypothetical protein [Nitratireductor luteus]